MKKIGLTGGIGVGKTYVAKIFQNMSIPVFNADLEAKQCMHKNQDVKNQITNRFGKQMYLNNVLQKKELAKIVFNDEVKMHELNDIVHPQVLNRFDAWCKSQDSSFIIKEAAILFESKSYLGLDAIICVTAPEDVRIDRVKQRDGLSESEILNRMKMQIPQSEKESRSDYIIINDNQSTLLPQVLSIKGAIEQD